MCSGAIGITYTTDESPWNYFFFTFFLGGVFATRLWSALLSLELVILLVFGSRFAILRWLLNLVAGWGLVTNKVHLLNSHAGLLHTKENYHCLLIRLDEYQMPFLVQSSPHYPLTEQKCIN